MKQNISVGNVVDDGTGDYLRKGGLKINNNFDELYYELGDGSTPFSAGAWKTWKVTDGTTLNIKFGQSYVVNTQEGNINVVLPKGTPADYNKVVRLRDVFSTWNKEPVTVSPASGDTMKGSAAPVIFNKNLQDLELVYCSPGRWEYLENKFVNKITSSDLSVVTSKSFIATEGQTDFLDILEGNSYNVLNTQVYRRGNRLYYVAPNNTYDADNSDFGSPGTAEGEIVILNGKDIRLKVPCTEGETIVIETFLDGVSTFQSSYNRASIQMMSSDFTIDKSVSGVRWVGDLSTKTSITLDDLGISVGTNVNQYSLEIVLNGRLLTQAGDANLPLARCDGAFGLSDAECSANGGLWVESDADFSVSISNDLVSEFNFDQPFEHGDILVVRWYNNNIGTTMGIDEITAVTDERYVNSQETVSLTNRIEYTDYANPSQKTKRAVADEIGVTISNVRMMFDSIYPIGTIYTNAHNPANPADYMGFGTWVLYGQGKALVGWNSDESDPYFALNNNDLDSAGIPSHSAGGTVGATKVELKANNIPSLSSTDKVLIADDNGTIVVGGCQFDPDSEGPGYDKYREGIVTVNPGTTTAVEVEIIQPSVTGYRWIRVA